MGLTELFGGALGIIGAALVFALAIAWLVLPYMLLRRLDKMIKLLVEIRDGQEGAKRQSAAGMLPPYKIPGIH